MKPNPTSMNGVKNKTCPQRSASDASDHSPGVKNGLAIVNMSVIAAMPAAVKKSASNS